MSHAFSGKLLQVDLSSGEIQEEALEEEICLNFLGGYGLAARLLFSRQKPHLDPLSEESLLIFAPGLLCGTGAPLASRCSIAARSPLTGTWGDSSFGGDFGAALKKAGYAAVLLRGIAPAPVYLRITPQGVALHDARWLWGKDTYQTQQEIKKELQEEALSIAVIGPAGEKCSRIASVIHDHGRAAARSGLGAVMGAKRLKAIAVTGARPVPLAHPQQFHRLCSQVRDALTPRYSLLTRLAENLAPRLLPWLTRLPGGRKILRWRPENITLRLFHQYGTTLGLALLTQSGDTPVKNWSGSSERDFPSQRCHRISDHNVIRYQTGDYGCADCPVRCGAVTRVAQGKFAVAAARRPEYEALAALGPLLLNDDVESIIKAYDLCNRYGMDVIEVGAAIGFIIECLERNILSPDATGGMALRWGDSQAIVELVDKIGRREGWSELLADGVGAAARRLGGAAENLAIQVQGQALGMHHPAHSPSLAVTYIADPTPGRHTAGNASFAETRGLSLPLEGINFSTAVKHWGEVQAAWSNYIQVVNCLGICLFSLNLGKLPLPELVAAATGWELSSAELLQTGERIQTLRHLFNLREGFRPSDFRLPQRLHPQLNPSGVEQLRAQYFRAMGWDEESGLLSLSRLRELGLLSIIPDDLL
jgi:aldehyde:ferredoxin oxidoreductase